MRDLHARASPCNTGLITRNEQVSGSSPLVDSPSGAASREHLGPLLETCQEVAEHHLSASHNVVAKGAE